MDSNLTHCRLVCQYRFLGDIDFANGSEPALMPIGFTVPQIKRRGKKESLSWKERREMKITIYCEKKANLEHSGDNVSGPLPDRC